MFCFYNRVLFVTDQLAGYRTIEYSLATIPIIFQAASYFRFLGAWANHHRLADSRFQLHHQRKFHQRADLQ